MLKSRKRQKVTLFFPISFQALIYDYQNAFVRIPKLIKNDDGGLPEFWLSLFREWLVKLQKAFDDDYARGAIWERDPEHGSGPGWDPEEASVDGILAYKLLVQTGHVDYPVDETLLSRNRLVDSHGIINRNAFYNYLSAWYSNDAMAYSYSQVKPNFNFMMTSTVYNILFLAGQLGSHTQRVVPQL